MSTIFSGDSVNLDINDNCTFNVLKNKEKLSIKKVPKE